MPVDTTAVPRAGSRPPTRPGCSSAEGERARSSAAREHPLLALDERGTASGFVAHVGRPHEGGGAGAVERDRSRGRDDGAEHGVEHGPLDAHLHAADGLDQGGGRSEIDGDEAGDREPGDLLSGAGRAARAADGVGAVEGGAGLGGNGLAEVGGGGGVPALAGRPGDLQLAAGA